MCKKKKKNHKVVKQIFKLCVLKGIVGLKVRFSSKPEADASAVF